MTQRVLLFFAVFSYFILIFLIGKTGFFFIHSSLGGNIASSDLFEVLYHGLPLDLSMSGYLTAIPALVLIFSIWIRPEYIAKVYNVYFLIIFCVIAVIAATDIAIYPYWGFHFDSSVFLYLQKPQEAFASASRLEIVLGTLGAIAFALILFAGYIFIIQKQVLKLEVPKSIAKTSVVLILLTAALFLPIRGGITVSTMNIGKAYFSDNMFLNHAAINPHFNLMASFFKSDDFGSQFQFFDKEEAEAIFNDLNSHNNSDSVISLLNTKRPNIILFILESFSYDVATDSLIAPNMSRYANEGIFFENFYANSFRTDRGLVSIMSGYPAHPTVAIMKYPNKTASLPSITRSLKDEGYEDMSFYYGGDADFANMRSYLVGTCGISNIISDKDFPLAERITKWGAPDQLLFQRFYKDLENKKQKTPFFKTVLTLSSHEPFDVPVTKFDNPFLNAVNYTDEHLGDFIENLRESELWNNTLIILMADHAMQGYPEGENNSSDKKFHIPMIWMGGAIKEPQIISDYASQNDLAATLLSQLNLKYDDFRFSKNILNPTSRKFAFYSYVNGFSMIDSTGTVIYDNDKQALLYQEGSHEIEKQAKAFFQNMYIDLGSR